MSRLRACFDGNGRRRCIAMFEASLSGSPSLVSIGFSHMPSITKLTWVQYSPRAIGAYSIAGVMIVLALYVSQWMVRYNWGGSDTFFHEVHEVHVESVTTQL